MFEQAALDGFASTHTCLPALKLFDTPLGERFVVNNGAAGMPNFANTRYGVVTRLATLPVPRACRRAFYGADVAGSTSTRWRCDSILPHGTSSSTAVARPFSSLCFVPSSHSNGPDFSVDEALGRTPYVSAERRNVEAVLDLSSLAKGCEDARTAGEPS